MNILVLGANGFLGRQVQSRLASLCGSEVQAAPSSGTLDLAHARPQAWDRLLDGAAPDAVVNCAGRTYGSPEELHAGNVTLVEGLIAAALRRPKPPHIVHLASAAEYGAVPENHASCEDGPARPLSPYGASKLAGTVLIEEAIRSGRVQAAVLRLTNPLGAGIGAGTLPGRAARELSVAALEGRDTVRFGPLGARRDFVDARDVARAVWHALTTELSGVVNVGSGQARPVRDLVDGLVALSGFRGQILEDAPGSPRSGDVPYQRADISRLLDSGFTLRHSFHDSLYVLLRGLNPAEARSAVLS